MVLYNKTIADNYRDIEMYVMLSEFEATFAYWAIKQDTTNTLSLIQTAIYAYRKYLQNKYFDTKDKVVKFTYTELYKEVSEVTFESIPAILALNETKPDFTDLNALARNMFFMICREHITQPL